MAIRHPVIDGVYGEIGWLLGIMSLMECIVRYDGYWASCH